MTNYERSLFFFWCKSISLRLGSLHSVSSSSCRAASTDIATSPYRSLPLAGLLGIIAYPHRAAVCMFELAVLLLLGHMWWGCIGVHNLWARLRLLVRVTWIVFVMGGRWPYSWCFVCGRLLPGLIQYCSQKSYCLVVFNSEVILKK